MGALALLGYSSMTDLRRDKRYTLAEQNELYSKSSFRSSGKTNTKTSDNILVHTVKSPVIIRSGTDPTMGVETAA